MSESVSASFKKAFRQPAFLAAFAVLLVAAAGLNTATEALQLHFKKLPVPLRKPVDSLPGRLGYWQKVSADEPLEHEQEDVLGTKNYIFRNYVDTRLVSPAVLAKFEDNLGSLERGALFTKICHDNPKAGLMLSFTYYTGMVDTVAHIPDRCYILGGWEPKDYTIQPWGALKDRPGDKNVRLLTMEDQTSGAPLRQNVAYFFHCNGDYESDPINGVRFKLQNLFEHYGYYSKIELMSTVPDGNAASTVMNEFLESALPEIEKCLPDWKEVKAQEAAGK